MHAPRAHLIVCRTSFELVQLRQHLVSDMVQLSADPLPVVLVGAREYARGEKKRRTEWRSNEQHVPFLGQCTSNELGATCDVVRERGTRGVAGKGGGRGVEDEKRNGRGVEYLQGSTSASGSGSLASACHIQIPTSAPSPNDSLHKTQPAGGLDNATAFRALKK